MSDWIDRAKAAEAEVEEWKEWSNYLATLLPENAETWPEEAHRLQQQRNEALRRLDAAESALRQVREDRDALKAVAEYALHLRMYGERAPGGDETWSKWESMVERVLRAADTAPESGEGR